MPYRIVFTPEAVDQIVSLYDYIVADGAPLIAERYTSAIVNYCEELNTFPHRGTRRDDIRPGLRITHYKTRTIIAYIVDDAAQQVIILGVFYGGQDYEAALDSDDEP